MKLYRNTEANQLVTETKSRGIFMSAPKTNIEKQKRRHWPAILGIAAALGIVVAVLLALGLWDGVPLDEQAAPAAATQD
ncbi:hypothetical protein [Rhodovulum sp. 12E13]|uniref:hypothetical protein n=1 Tax=Rhodovulum sp. 12E13 TaxID=2203891 RepID=UPI0011C01F27|nr:hypothetical protein [Rhodovulum sp. 12E13]